MKPSTIYGLLAIWIPAIGVGIAGYMLPNKSVYDPVTHYDVFQVIQITETSTTNITLKQKNKETIVVFSVISSKCPNIEAITIGSWWALETYMRGEVRLISAYSMCEIQNE